jgi:hypothetical protein
VIQVLAVRPAEQRDPPDDLGVALWVRFAMHRFGAQAVEIFEAVEGAREQRLRILVRQETALAEKQLARPAEYSVQTYSGYAEYSRTTARVVPLVF